MGDKPESSTTNVTKNPQKRKREDDDDEVQEPKPKVAKYNKLALVRMRDKLISVVLPRTMPSIENAIVIDVEATGLEVSETEMVQLAAVSMANGVTFNQYIYPANSDFSYSAANMTGMCKRDGKLYRKGVFVASEAIESFLTWLKTNTQGQAVLFSHSCRILNAILLCKAVMEAGREDDFMEAVVSFGDTFPACKEKLLGCRKFSLKFLYQRTFHRSFQGHDALADATALRQLMQRVFSSDWGDKGMLRRHCFTVKDYMAALK